jgi:tagatose 1,6-diphosphate aldolase
MMTPTTLSLGKIRGLQQCSTPRGAISVLALDHRNNLRNAMRPDAPQTVTSQDMVTFKQEVISILSPVSTAVLLDPEFGAPQCIAASSLPGATGLLVAVEQTGYTGDPAARISQIADDWSVAKPRRMGATAVKLLAYYHPQAPTAKGILDLVKKVADQCAEADIPLFLEALSYPADPSVKKLSPAERHDVVLETARRLVIPGVDVFKAEFPLDAKADPDEGHWAAACAELTAASRAPWVLLSASVDYETFLRQVTIACRNGATGVAVGRAVWQEAPTLTGAARTVFLTHVARPRMARITALVDALARPWTEYFQPAPVDDTWYRAYPEA